MMTGAAPSSALSNCRMILCDEKTKNTHCCPTLGEHTFAVCFLGRLIVRAGAALGSIAPKVACSPRVQAEARGASLGWAAIWFAVSWTLLARALTCQSGFDSFLLARLQIERVPLDVLDNVLLQDFSFEALERAFQAFAIMQLNFSQRNPPRCSNSFDSSA